MSKKNTKKVDNFELEAQKTALLEARIAELEARLAAVPRTHGSARREQILTALREGPMSIKGLAMELSTPDNPVSVRNVSSILTGIRKAGYIIHTDEQSRKYLVSEPDEIEKLPGISDLDSDPESDFDDVNTDSTEFQESQDHED